MGKAVGIAVGLVSLINIPVGTALGYYTLQFFYSEGGINIYGGKKQLMATEGELEDAVDALKPLMRWSKGPK